MLRKGYIPTPDSKPGSLWNAIAEYYKLPALKPVDDVLSQTVLPPGWKIKPDVCDSHGRWCIIYDHEGQAIGQTFLKKTSYEYKGYTVLFKDRLQAIGVIQADKKDL